MKKIIILIMLMLTLTGCNTNYKRAKLTDIRKYLFGGKKMTEELIKMIVEAEAQAEEIKTQALAQASEIMAQAEADVLTIERDALLVSKKYRETEQKNALAEAEKEYAVSLEKNRMQAKEYCAKVLKSAEGEIGNIVGRIIGGDR